MAEEALGKRLQELGGDSERTGTYTERIGTFTKAFGMDAGRFPRGRPVGGARRNLKRRWGKLCPPSRALNKTWGGACGNVPVRKGTWTENKRSVAERVGT